MTAESPTLPEIWPELCDFINERPLVAHNAAFDMGVLRASLATGGTPCPDLTYACTYQLARRVWRGRLSYRLDDLADEGGLYLDHHEAGSDAATAALLGVALCGVAGQPNLLDAVHAIGLRTRHVSEFGQSMRHSDLRPDADGIPEGSPFIGKTVVFSGALELPRSDAAQLVVNAGGRVATTVSRNVDYLVVGVQDADEGQGRCAVVDDDHGGVARGGWGTHRAAVRGRVLPDAARPGGGNRSGLPAVSAA